LLIGQSKVPIANRVDPFGALVSTDSRGSLMGNRGGRFHVPGQRTATGRQFVTKQWICCRLAFKGRQRRVWSEGYTELFFMDEVTALAAGHRPCFECRRIDAIAFATAWGGLSGGSPARAPAMDAVLHCERLVPGRPWRKRLHPLAPATLPVGSMLVWQGVAWAVAETGLARWTPDGFLPPRCDLLQDLVHDREVPVLTPPAILACLRAGYAPQWRWLQAR
jgi:hypothetical protein